ncbi:protein transport protein Sec16A isoform X1 [Corythoichthys intestinalis]|uniref:protein transport protein Sec16A isoform X1 n=1 Tax=Corythoichthys intestinalis TaxID=161448 RepID=UPI0025A52F67|nr:protein transport protein Sec16A isoform X1 [Corythoichthys intestinalis]XP_057674906.1 protein transport protein Sec16A isoform X1 [Corythoichthys intestinalis]XP_057674907.1 protein transport protein Sec16A isoform X1 [Corythoichthys intestinalis]
MQPPPRTGPPGASGPPPPSGPNMFRRTRPLKHAGATATPSSIPLSTQPMTDPFAFVRAPPSTSAGGAPVLQSNSLPAQAPPTSTYTLAGLVQDPQLQTLEGIPAAPAGTQPSSLPGVPMFSPHSSTSPGVRTEPAHSEQGYFNSREHTLAVAAEPPSVPSEPVPSQTFNQEYHAQSPPQPVPFQPVPPAATSSQRASDHGSRPPSVQNYFQPTSDPPQQPFNPQPQAQMHPSNAPTPPTQFGHPQNPLLHQNPANTPGSHWAGPNTTQQHNSHFQHQSYFMQTSAPQDAWFSQAPQDPAYHQMANAPLHLQPQSDCASHHIPNVGSQHGSASTAVQYAQDSGTLSMFFNDDVENEETLAGERKKVMNGIPDPSHLSNNSQGGPPAQSGLANVPFDNQASRLQDNSHIPYMNDGNAASQGRSPNPSDSQYDHVENLECVPNQEVLPSEIHGSPAGLPAAHAVDTYETGPNLETPDSLPRPIRSASASSNYSNMSHGSGTAGRRHQGVVSTFIQQESPRPADDANLPPGAVAAAGGYFEQIDSSPAGNAATQPSPSEQMWPTTPSPPKPTGTFQASANSSFEPVRLHGVGVRPAEVDRAKMVAEGGTDPTPGNLEQPPDNLENIYGPGHPLPIGVPHLTNPVVQAHSRPSSRALGASRPCESPATTLWAQSDPTNLGASIVLAPAAPTVLAPLREPSVDVIQPPEDGPLDLHPPQRTPQQHSENLENPPKVSELDNADSQGNLGYASLLVSESLQQPVLIAPPVSNYVIPPSTFAQVPSQSTAPTKTFGQAASVSLTSGLPFNQNPLSPPAPASNPVPLNLTRESAEASTSGSALAQPHPVRPSVSHGQSLSRDTHLALPVNPPTSLTAASVTNHNQSSNYELLDFSMHQSQSQIQASGHPSALHESSQSSNGFYMQVTKDAQHGLRMDVNAPVQTPGPSAPPQVTTASLTSAPPTMPTSSPSAPQFSAAPSSSAPPVSVVSSANTGIQPQPDPPRIPEAHAAAQAQSDPSFSVRGAQPSSSQYPSQMQGAATASVPPGSIPSQQAPSEPPRPPSSSGSQQGYGPPPPGPGQMYGGYYGNYGEYPDGRAPYPSGPYPPGDPRAQQYYQEGPYRSRGDPWYGRYEGPNPAYRDPNYQYREPQPERPSSRTSQYSDRPSSRQGYTEDYHRANRSAYDEYYANYAKHYDYAGYNYGHYDPRYRGYYDQSYWSTYDDAYRSRDNYYNQQMYPNRKEGYDDQWRYYPGYDSSFDDDYRRRGGDAYNDDFDRRSVHSEQSAHSVHSSHSHHSRRSSFSSRSQQSQAYRSQPDLVSAVYDATSSTLPVDYSYGQYPNQTDASQNYGQYLYPSEYTSDSTWIAPEQPPPRPATPEKFTMPHRCARFGPGGHLVQVLPNLPSAGQPALVDIHNLETMLQNSLDQEELRSFPGPLVKEETHKVDVIKFSQNKAVACSHDNNLLDRDSARLLWDFIVLLCRQNGTVVGTDIADLLLKEHRSVWLPGKSPNEANLIDFNNEPLARAEEEPGAGPLSLLSDTFMTVPENVGKETERFRELLLFGRKKDALEAAMKAGLWGHALLLASKMDNRTHARVMTRFANSLPINDPLQTVYQLMSGRMPASATCCGEEKWGDWRPHLAMVLSNLTHTLDLDTRTITTMGDTLASKGLIDAAHFCYLMAQTDLGVYTKKSTKMVLVGSNHSLPFSHFATNEAIQRTEAYEYAQSLGSQPCPLPNFQVFKLIYACRLAEAGLSAQAFQYCEVISRTVLVQPSYYSPVFISQVIQMSEKLRFFDPQLKEKPEQELFNEPDWLIQLRHLDGQIRTGGITYNGGRTSPAQLTSSSPSSDLDQPSPGEPYNMSMESDGPGPDNPLMSSLLPGPTPQGIQLVPPAPASILQDGMGPPQPPCDVPQFYPVPPSGPTGHVPLPGYPSHDPAYAPPQFQPPPMQSEMYPGAHQQPGPPALHMGQMSPVTPLPQVPHSPVQGSHPHMPPSPGHMGAPPEMEINQPISPHRSPLTPKMDFYDHMAQLAPGRRSRTTSQSSVHRASGRRSRTTSESSTHSGGRDRSNSAAKQASPPPPPIPEQPRKEEGKKTKKESPKKSGGGVGWLTTWLYRKGKNEAHLPDDKNKSIVWDEKKQKWVDLNEPEEESKPLAPPPSGFPKMAPMPVPPGSAAPPSSGPPVNMFSRRAGLKSRYVDVLNPGGGGTKPAGVGPPAPPMELFAPLAPMSMPTNLFVPSSAPSDQQPMEGSEGGLQKQTSPNSSVPQMFNPTLLPPVPQGPPALDGSQSGELSRSSSMSSLSREVSQHLNQSHPGLRNAPVGGAAFL